MDAREIHHPFVEGLLGALPDPGEGRTEWPVEMQVKWLRAAAAIFDLIYEKEGGEIKIGVMRDT